MSKEETAEIRVIKRKNSHSGHHGGAWKVAYADFMTAMMAFFLVMWIVGLSNPVKQAVAAYFKDPTGFMEATNGGKSPFKVSESAGGLHDNKESPKNVASERVRLEEAKRAIEAMVTSTPDFKKFGKNIDIELVPEGLRIDLVEAKESLFFDSGSAKVKPATTNLLKQIAVELKKLPNKVILEGHTDSRPLGRTDGYTNWELSADRANSARNVFESSGMSESQIAQVRGYAATVLRDPQNPTHFSNRRVSIVVVTSDALKSQQIGGSGENKLPIVKSKVMSVGSGR